MACAPAEVHPVRGHTGAVAGAPLVEEDARGAVEKRSKNKISGGREEVGAEVVERGMEVVKRVVIE